MLKSPWSCEALQDLLECWSTWFSVGVAWIPVLFEAAKPWAWVYVVRHSNTDIEKEDLYGADNVLRSWSFQVLVSLHLLWSSPKTTSILFVNLILYVINLLFSLLSFSFSLLWFCVRYFCKLYIRHILHFYPPKKRYLSHDAVSRIFPFVPHSVLFSKVPCVERIVKFSVTHLWFCSIKIK